MEVTLACGAVRIMTSRSSGSTVRRLRDTVAVFDYRCPSTCYPLLAPDFRVPLALLRGTVIPLIIVGWAGGVVGGVNPFARRGWEGRRGGSLNIVILSSRKIKSSS